MRKGWKKGLSVLLTLVMLMSLCSTAFAAPKSKTWTIKLRVLEISDDYRLGYSFVSGSTSRNYEVDSNVNNWITVPSFETVIGELGYSVKEGYSFVGITWDQTADDQSMINIKTTDTSQQISNVYVTSNGYTVWYVVKKPVQQAPSAPGTADLSGILGNYPVKVDCTNDAAAHADALYALDPSSCTVGAVSGTSANGYTCTVTIAGAGYVAQYNQTNGAHTLSNATADVQLSWNGKAWTAAGTLPVVFNVVCAPSPTPTPTPTPTSGPDAPDDSMLPSILGDAVVTVDCTSESANHADGTYGYIAGGITVGAVAGDAQNGYTCTLTVDSSVYLAQYNEDRQAAHTLVAGETASKSIVLNWDGVNAQWVLGSTLPVVFEVECQSGSQMGTVVVYAVTDGDKDNAVQIYSGTAAKGSNLIAYLEENVELESKTGYALDKWFNWDWYGNKFGDDAVVNGWMNVYVTYTGDWQTVNVYAVTDGDKDNAELISSGKVLKGSNLLEYLEANVKPAAKTGYIIDKWFNWDWYGNKFGDDAVVNGWTNVYVTYTGDWQTVNVYAVTDGDKDNAALIYDGKALKGAGLIEYLEKNVTVAEKTGYAVDKWYNWDYYGNKFGDDDVVNGWTNVYVTYLSQAYTIVYHGNGGVLASDAQKDQTTSGAKYGQEVTLKNNKTFVRTGYVLTGWATQQDGEKGYDCSQKITDIPGVVDGKVHLYAVWQKHEDHKWVSTGTTATCTEAGEESFKCEICGETKTEPQAALGHEWDAWADDENGRTHTHACKREGCDVTETKWHSWKETERVEPTRKLDGYVKYECEDCHAVYTKVLPALNNKPTYPDYSGDDGVIIIPDSTLRPVTTNTLTPVVTPVPVQPGDPIYTMVPNVPKTGDATNNMPYVLTIGGAAAMLALVLALKKRAGGKA